MEKSQAIALFFVALAAMLPSACARTPWKIAEAPHPTTTVPSTANTSVQDLEFRLLRYVNSLKAPADLSYQRMESALGIKFTGAADAAHSWRNVKDVPLPGGFTLYATHSPAEKGFSSIEVVVNLPSGRDPTRVPTDICIWDAAKLSQQLQAIGYKRGGQRPFQGGWIRQHWRSIKDNTQGFSVALLIYRVDQASSRECVRGVQIDGGDE
ncbi:hypothetical protein [Xanthomonas translucens]|uniref:hypothetical protein n=2 Tax=Xanthomonas campestris pv. translucens TaxID=343 RepID=UPI0009B76867|nr:hypothetical protein [Xanthomonas translucens]MBC3972620.1 hypothetical protein [Xanthomonas translucens pv. undulosa]MCT8281712.1 hypothetical protein [Xanthomonas translucens pv. undulosa]MCT8316403.1 hypothetical protein [Xanthomonas translucens pv. undulosa]QSQ55877.1 hypothetical protein ISN37_15955 [Xanthomonas translucens pv. undulosa]UKE39460.1 hypothetical protein KCU58_17830 [Xanthomonas translucens pv. undulosa]